MSAFLTLVSAFTVSSTLVTAPDVMRAMTTLLAVSDASVWSMMASFVSRTLAHATVTRRGTLLRMEVPGPPLTPDPCPGCKKANVCLIVPYVVHRGPHDAHARKTPLAMPGVCGACLLKLGLRVRIEVPV